MLYEVITVLSLSETAPEPECGLNAVIPGRSATQGVTFEIGAGYDRDIKQRTSSAATSPIKSIDKGYDDRNQTPENTDRR